MMRCCDSTGVCAAADAACCAQLHVCSTYKQAVAVVEGALFIRIQQMLLVWHWWWHVDTCGHASTLFSHICCSACIRQQCLCQL
jgi:hypothetical protein